MAKKKNGNRDNLEPQKSSAAQFITYVASTGESNEKFSDYDRYLLALEEEAKKGKE